ncbi:MAG: hypothetical protein KBT44_03260 [Bacteroidales bacterium]|nr:hypothetical protein [Candidatus Equibacterium intestinale]
MKKVLLILASAVLLLAGCAKEQISDSANSGETVNVKVVAQLLNEEQTKASWDNDGNGTKVDHWIMEVYDAQDKLYDRQEKTGQSGLTNTFNLILIKNQSYKFAFWADTEGSYDTDTLTKVKTVSNVAGLDSRDAFFAKTDYTPAMGNVITAKLYRPFAQINMVTLDLKKIYAQMSAANTAGEYSKYIPKDFKLSCQAYTKFDVLTGTASGAQNTELTLASCYADFSAHAAKTTIFMDYLFATAEKELKDLTFTFKSNGVAVDYSFANIPLQRNYRTNISGNLLSNDATVNVEIIPIWNEPEYNEELWSAGMITPVTPENDVYTISLPSELAWIAQQVNNGNTFAGKTVKLAKDIDLNNGEWTPAGNVSGYPGTAFMGTFDGNNYKIMNLKCSDNTKDYASAALFGTGKDCVIKNVTLENVNVSSAHFGAALLGYVADGIATIQNCMVKNGTVTSTPEKTGTGYDNGDKVGGLLGYGANACKISGCTVEGLAIKAYRDLGGIAGAVKCAEIKNNIVKNCTITADQTVNFYGKKDYNVGAIVGRCLEGTVDESNTAEGITVKTFGNAIEKALDEAVAGATVIVEESVSNIVIPATLAENVTLKQADNVVVDKISIPAGADIKGLVLEEFTPAIQAISGTDFNNGFIDISKDAKVENLLIQNCEFVGPNTKNRTAIFIEPSETAQPRTIEIKNCSCKDIRYFVYTNGQIPGTTLKVSNCQVTNMFSWAILINSGNIAGLDVQNCTFSGGDIVKVMDANKDTDFTFTFKNNTITGDTATLTLKAKPENTLISGNTKNGEEWNPSIGVLN